MKKLLPFFLLLLLMSCARKGPDFIPLSLQWFAYSGDLSAFGKDLSPELVSESMTSQCMISLTQTLMGAPIIRTNAGGGMEFDVQYYGLNKGGDINLMFRGRCHYSDTTDLEKSPLILNPKPQKEGCSWTARCTESGRIKDLLFLGHTKVQRRKHLGQ